jgi:hypothetical protein
MPLVEHPAANLLRVNPAFTKRFPFPIRPSSALGADYYGKPYFLGASDLGKTGFFTF